MDRLRFIVFDRVSSHPVPDLGNTGLTSDSQLKEYP